MTLDEDERIPPSVLQDMQQFVKGFTFRDISIKSHCHGYRVTLKHDFREIVTEVEESVEEAFIKCLKGFPKALKNVRHQKIKDVSNKIRELEQDLEKAKEQKKDLIKSED